MKEKKISTDRKRSRQITNKSKYSKVTKNKIGMGIVLIIVIFVIIGIYFVYTEIVNINNDGLSDDKTNNGHDVGEDFTFTTLEGKEKKLSNYRGKVVVLDLWATWCEPCQTQMLELRKIYQYYDMTELQILSVDVGIGETASQIIDFKQQFANYGYSLDWTFGLEKDNLDEYMPESGIPTLVIFDQQGNLKYRHVGFSFFNEIPDNFPANQPKPPLLKEKIDELL